MQMQGDKLILDLSDSDELKEFFSRKAAGDTVSGRFEATIDEIGQPLVTLSIDDIKMAVGKGGKSVEDDDTQPEPNEAPAVKVSRKRKKQAQEPAEEPSAEDETLAG